MQNGSITAGNCRPGIRPPEESLWQGPETLIGRLMTYNRRKIEHVAEWVLENCRSGGQDRLLLDVGCGTGELFTLPLYWTLKGKCKVGIHGIDLDPLSIERASFHKNRLGLNGIRFSRTAVEAIQESHDFVSLIEVLEHLENPSMMLNTIRDCLRPKGLLFMSTPHGYGLGEIENDLCQFLRIEALFKMGRRVKHSLMLYPSQKPPSIFDSLDTVHRPHIQRYTIPRLRRLLEQAGFDILSIHNTKILGGPISDFVLHRARALERAEVKLAENLPLMLGADWLFICRKD